MVAEVSQPSAASADTYVVKHALASIRRHHTKSRTYIVNRDLRSTGYSPKARNGRHFAIPAQKRSAANVCRWPYEVDVFGHMLRQRVSLVAADVFRVIGAVAIDEVFSTKEILCFSHRQVKVESVARLAEANLMRVDSDIVHEPGMDRVDSLLGRPEGVGNFRGSPMLPVVWRFRIRDIEQIRVKIVEIGLRESELERHCRVGISATVERPSVGNGTRHGEDAGDERGKTEEEPGESHR